MLFLMVRPFSNFEVCLAHYYSSIPTNHLERMNSAFTQAWYLSGDLASPTLTKFGCPVLSGSDQDFVSSWVKGDVLRDIVDLPVYRYPAVVSLRVPRQFFSGHPSTIASLIVLWLSLSKFQLGLRAVFIDVLPISGFLSPGRFKLLFLLRLLLRNIHDPPGVLARLFYSATSNAISVE